jgi:hypothetical protein
MKITICQRADMPTASYSDTCDESSVVSPIFRQSVFRRAVRWLYCSSNTARVAILSGGALRSGAGLDGDMISMAASDDVFADG